MEPRRPFDPLRPIQPLPSPFRPPAQNVGPRDEDFARLLKESLDRGTIIEARLKNIEETLKPRK